MQTMIDLVEVLYCEGWDAGARAVVAPLSPAQARARDRSGEQYAVLLLSAGAPQALLEISWRHHACTVWRFDHRQRRTARYDLRRLTDEHLVLIEQIAWRYPESRDLDFDHTTGRSTRRHDLGLTASGPPRCPVPVFGDWAPVARLAGITAPATAFVEPADLPPGVPLSPLTAPPWRPPVPLQPAPLEPRFRTGTGYDLPDRGPVTVEVREVGRLRMPTGRLVVADPGVLHDGIPPGLLTDSVPFTAQVPPGSYPVTLSLLRPIGQPERQVTVAAARLAIRPEPVASWEMALRPGDDLRLLGAGEFFGFGVDTGTACFVDAAAVSGVTEAAQQHRALLRRVAGDRTVEVAEPRSGGNLIAFPCAGLGEYPTWVGRTVAGEVACFVADLLVLGSR